MTSLFASLSRYRDVGVLFIRIAFGFQLIKVSYLNALYPHEHLPQFVAYQQALGLPFPTLGSYLAAYTEFIGGILIMVGLTTRWAALLLTINFGVAVSMGHLAIHDDYANTFPAANLLAVSIFLLLNGPGQYALDARWGLKAN